MAGGDLGAVTLVCGHVEVGFKVALRIEVASAMIGKQHAI
jgi:hypothetical protein